MDDRPEFRSDITLSKDEVFDIVSRCDDVVSHAEQIGEMSIAFGVDSVRKFLLGRLMGEPGDLDE